MLSGNDLKPRSCGIPPRVHGGDNRFGQLLQSCIVCLNVGGQRKPLDNDTYFPAPSHVDHAPAF
jgi:hypothetical protein